MRKLDFYRAAAQNLGLTSLIRMQLQKRFGADEQFHITSKHLDYPVLASGLNLTFESETGFPPHWSRASLAHANRNFHHSQAQ